jgi:hypothetical protein
VQVLWRVAVVAATTAARRNKGVWSSLGLGLSLASSSDILLVILLVTFLVILLVILFISMAQV